MRRPLSCRPSRMYLIGELRPRKGRHEGAGRSARGRELAGVGAPPREHRRAAARAEGDGLVDRATVAERVGDAGREAVAAAVGVLDRTGQRRRTERSAGPDPAAEPPGGRDDDPRLRIEPARLDALAGIAAAADEDVDLLGSTLEGLELPRRR